MMKTLERRLFSRVLVCVLTGFLILTHVVQARQGLLQAAAFGKFEMHCVCETAATVFHGDFSGRGTSSWVLEAPVSVSMLAIVLQNLDRLPLTPVLTDNMTEWAMQDVQQQQYRRSVYSLLRYIHSIPLSVVLRL